MWMLFCVDMSFLLWLLGADGSHEGVRTPQSHLPGKSGGTTVDRAATPHASDNKPDHAKLVDFQRAGGFLPEVPLRWR
jgi:hypothetical protein